MNEVIRVYMLDVGDIFMRQGIEYIVLEKTDRIHYRPVQWNHVLSFGLNSQERIILISSGSPISGHPDQDGATV